MYTEKSPSLFLLYNCGTVAVVPHSVAEMEVSDLAYTLDSTVLLQKLQKNTVHLLLETKYTFTQVEYGVSLSHSYSALLRQAERPAVRRTHKSGQKPAPTLAIYAEVQL